MFGNERLDKLQNSLEKAIALMGEILKQDEATRKSIQILSTRVLQLDDPQKAAFGTVRR